MRFCGRAWQARPAGRLPLVRLDSRLDFLLDGRQVEGGGRLHRREIDGGFFELGHDFLDKDKALGFTAREFIELRRSALRVI